MSSPSFSNEIQQATLESPTCRTAKPWQWVIWTVRNYIRLDLALHNRLHVEQQDLEMLRDLPKGMGIILAANHADETDFKVCLEPSRLSGRRFLYLTNSEAFDEGYGIAGTAGGDGP